MATKEYELLADSFNEITSKPGDPLQYTERRKGAKIKLEDARAQELIAAGAVKAPSGSGRRGPKAGDQTEAPKGKAADQDAEPQGTGSTTDGDGGGAGDGQGSADGNPSSTGKGK